MTDDKQVALRDQQLPEHLRGATKTARIGNVDTSDIIIPRVKLLQAISSEVTTFTNAKAGTFWHTIAEASMGSPIIGIPIVIRKTYALWSPRADDRGILARANDGIHWDVPGAEFTIKPKGSPKPITYKLGKTVQENGMDQFGSSIPEDPNSPPAASLTYHTMWWFPEFRDYSPAIIINTRSSVKKAKMLISKIELRPVNHYAQKFAIGAVQEQGEEGPFWNYSYASDGFADEEQYKVAEALYNKYVKTDFVPSDERDDTVAGGEAAENGVVSQAKAAGGAAPAKPDDEIPF